MLNLYNGIGNPYFELDGDISQRAIRPADRTHFCPDDLVALPARSWDSFPDAYPFTADEARTLLWMFAGDVTRAAKYYRMPAARLRSFIRKVPRIAADYEEMQERLLDLAEQVIHDALFSDDPKRVDAAARFILSKSKYGRARSVVDQYVAVAADEATPIAFRWLE